MPRATAERALGTLTPALSRRGRGRTLCASRETPLSPCGSRVGVRGDVNAGADHSTAWLVDLIEHAAVGEVHGLRLLPTAEHLVYGEQVHLGELTRILRRRRLQPRS